MHSDSLQIDLKAYEGQIYGKEEGDIPPDSENTKAKQPCPSFQQGDKMPVPTPPEPEVVKKARLESDPVMETVRTLSDEALGQILVETGRELAKRFNQPLSVIGGGFAMTTRFLEKIGRSER